MSRVRSLSTVKEVMQQERIAFQLASRARLQSEVIHGSSLRLTSEKMRAVFSLFDSEETGSVDADELGLLLNAVGVEVDATTMQTLQQGCANGKVSLEKFEAILAQVVAPMDSADEAARVFSLIDFTGSGYISLENLKEALLRSDARVSDEEVREVLRYCDVDEDGKVSKPDFLTVMSFVSEIGL